MDFRMESGPDTFASLWMAFKALSLDELTGKPQVGVEGEAAQALSPGPQDTKSGGEGRGGAAASREDARDAWWGLAT